MPAKRKKKKLPKKARNTKLALGVLTRHQRKSLEETQLGSLGAENLTNGCSQPEVKNSAKSGKAGKGNGSKDYKTVPKNLSDQAKILHTYVGERSFAPARTSIGSLDKGKDRFHLLSNLLKYGILIRPRLKFDYDESGLNFGMEADEGDQYTDYGSETGTESDSSSEEEHLESDSEADCQGQSDLHNQSLSASQGQRPKHKEQGYQKGIMPKDLKGVEDYLVHDDKMFKRVIERCKELLEQDRQKLSDLDVRHGEKSAHGGHSSHQGKRNQVLCISEAN